MYKIKECIVVEGRYDKIKLSSFLDAVIIQTNGFSIYKNKQQLRFIKEMAYKTGIVILTDSDSAGFRIRNFIKQDIPPELVKHAYIPDIKGKEKRKREPGKEGLLGVEGVEKQIILDALKTAGCTIDNENAKKSRGEITKADLYKIGLFGKSESTKKRAELLEKLKLPSKLSSNMLVKVLNQLMTLDELCDFIQKNITE